MNAHFEFYNQIYFKTGLSSSQMVFLFDDLFLRDQHIQNRATAAGKLAMPLPSWSPCTQVKNSFSIRTFHSVFSRSALPNHQDQRRPSTFDLVFADTQLQGAQTLPCLAQSHQMNIYN